MRDLKGRTEAGLVLGLDLAGSPRRPTGVCRFAKGLARTRLLHADDEILGYVLEERPVLVAQYVLHSAIAAAVSLPRNRASFGPRVSGLTTGAPLFITGS